MEGKPTQSSLIKKLINFSKKKGNAHVVLGFVCPTNELKDYSDKPVKQASAQKQPLFRNSHCSETAICSETVHQEVFFKKGVL